MRLKRQLKTGTTAKTLQEHKMEKSYKEQLREAIKNPLLQSYATDQILTTIEDALYVLDNTELDAVVVEDYLFLKK